MVRIERNKTGSLEGLSVLNHQKRLFERLEMLEMPEVIPEVIPEAIPDGVPEVFWMQAWATAKHLASIWQVFGKYFATI